MTTRTPHVPRRPTWLPGAEALEVRLVVWKGADALRRGTTRGDVDILVHPANLDDFVRAMTARGLVRAVEGPYHHDPHVLSLLGVDEDGGLVHVDAATTLVLQRPPWRTVTLDLIDVVIDRSRVAPDLGVRTTTPADEAALRLLEWAHVPPLPLRRRRRWQRVVETMATTNPAEVTDAMGLLAGAAAGAAVARPSVRRSRSMRRALRSAVRPRLEREPWGRAWPRLVAVAWCRLVATIGRPTLRRRGLAGGGRIVAVVGADGAGKSSLVHGLAAELAPKVAVRTVYFGSGDGPSSWYRAPLRLVRRLVGDRVSRVSTGTEATRRPAEVLARAAWASTLAVEKAQKAARADRARRRGVLVVCDRYPQVQFSGGHDGPLLASWSDDSSAWRRGLARWERRCYRRALRTVPDLVLHLDVDLATARSRRPAHDPDDLADRIDRIARLDLGATTHRVDASDTPGRVRAAALRAVLSLAERV